METGLALFSQFHVNCYKFLIIFSFVVLYVELITRPRLDLIGLMIRRRHGANNFMKFFMNRATRKQFESDFTSRAQIISRGKRPLFKWSRKIPGLWSGFTGFSRQIRKMRKLRLRLTGERSQILLLEWKSIENFQTKSRSILEVQTFRRIVWLTPKIAPT